MSFSKFLGTNQTPKKSAFGWRSFSAAISVFPPGGFSR
jgi:hypothetical protein